MTRDRARRILQRFEQNKLSLTERDELVNEVALFLLRAAVSSPAGRVTFELDDATAPYSPAAITHDQD